MMTRRSTLPFLIRTGTSRYGSVASTPGSRAICSMTSLLRFSKKLTVAS